MALPILRHYLIHAQHSTHMEKLENLACRAQQTNSVHLSDNQLYTKTNIHDYAYTDIYPYPLSSQTCLGIAPRSNEFNRSTNSHVVIKLFEVWIVDSTIINMKLVVIRSTYSQLQLKLTSNDFNS